MVEPLDTKAWRVYHDWEEAPGQDYYIGPVENGSLDKAIAVRLSKENADAIVRAISSPSLPVVDGGELVARLRNTHFNNAEEGRGSSTRTVPSILLRDANDLFSKAANAISSQKQEIEELRYLISEVEQGDKVRDNQIEAADSRVQSLEEALRHLSECNLTNPNDFRQFARNALKVNGNG